jgi:DNA-binding SARP family transcriptional activator
LEIRTDGTPVDVPRPRRRAVLAFLLLHANSWVSVEQLIDALWAQAPPRTARAQVHTAISQLRSGHPTAVAGRLSSLASGYRLRVEEDALDVTLFGSHLATARELVSQNQSEAAVPSLRAALGLWRGAALAGIDAPFVEPARARLAEERFAAYELLAELELTAGHHLALIPELTALLDQYPARESITKQLVVALCRSGRQADALAVLRRSRSLLVDEYGLDPASALVTLELAILRGDPTLRCPVTDHTAPADEPPTGAARQDDETVRDQDGASPRPSRWQVPRPALLPARTAGFVGRDRELGVLARLLDSGPDTTQTAVISGPAGAGKTALALHWSHGCADAFPDGQLYVDLNGYGSAEAEQP